MPKISAYPAGGKVQDTDKFVLARAGNTYSALGSDVKGNETVTYITGGAGNWSPAASTRYFFVEVVGGGGAGGGCTGAAANLGLGSGGSAGGYAAKKYTAPLAASYAYSVGAAGVGVANAAGGDGGDTTFDTITGVGGKGGDVMASGSALAVVVAAVMAGGAGSGGDINIYGGPAGVGIRLSGSVGVSGRGGDSRYGVGAAPRVTNAAGFTGLSYGAGGGGAFQAGSAVNRAGGNGAAGIIIIHEFS